VKRKKENLKIESIFIFKNSKVQKHENEISSFYDLIGGEKKGGGGMKLRRREKSEIHHRHGLSLPEEERNNTAEMPGIQPYRRSAIKTDRTVQPENCDCENRDKRNSSPPSHWSLSDEDVLVCTTCETPPSVGMLETESRRTLYNREVGSSLLDEDGEIHEIHYSTQRRTEREVQSVYMMQAELYDLLAAAKQCLL
jgi:hypothetical protein